MSDSAPLPRLIILHKQSTSARVRFLTLGDSVLAFAPLPVEATLHADDYAPTLRPHPAAAVRTAEQRLGLAEGQLEAVADFCLWIATPDGDQPILLAACTSIDPPFAAAEAHDGKFIAITEARRLPLVEREILRRTYEHILG